MMGDAATQKVSALSATAAAEQLVNVVRLLADAKTLEAVITIVKSAARQITQADGASFVLRDGKMCYYVDEDAVEPLWKGRRFPMESCVSGWAMRHQQSAVIPDVFADNRVPHDAYRPTFVKSMAMVPIRTLRPVGAIGIYWRQPHSPTPDAIRWLQSLADSTALAIEHVQGLQEVADAELETQLLREKNAELRKELAQLESEECIRMCFITKRVEVDGHWLSIEAFLQRRLGLQITHGLSPEGLARFDEEDVSLELTNS